MILKDHYSKRAPNIFITTKLTVILIVLGLQVSAAAYSQISLDYRNAKLWDVLQSIRKQSGYSFGFKTDILDSANPVTLTLKSSSIEEILHSVFINQPFNYQIRGKSIVVFSKPVEKKSPVPPIREEQHKDINGTVKDEQGNSLPGATVILKEQNNRVTVTDGDGRFSFTNAPDQGTIMVRMLGRETREIKYQNSNAIALVLKEINTDLKVTVIKGYYTTTKELNTGSVGTLKAADIAKQPVSDPLMALEGRISGLYVSQRSGVPGASLNLIVRGLNSISNGTSPLYVVDGIPFNSTSLSQVAIAAQQSPFANIRPDDIESIDVLKDADATAIYGSRGANGVILITTKKGSAGKTKLDVNLYHGVGKITRMLNLMNTQQYLEMRNEAFKNDDSTPEFFDYDVNGTWDKNRYTNWQKVMIGGSSKITDAKVTLSGGTLQTQFLMSLGYRKENTIFPGDFANQIGSANFNISHASDDKKLHVNLSVNYANNNNQLPQADFTSYIFMAPNAPALYDSKGQLNWENGTFFNPFAYLQQKTTSITENLIGNLITSYNITNDLQVKSNFSYNTIRLNESATSPYTSFNPLYAVPATDYRYNTSGSNAIKSWSIEPQLNYNKTFSKHHIEALIATTFQANIQTGSVQSASGFSSDALIENTGAARVVVGNNNYTQYKYSAIFMRVGYNYAEKYILNLTGRKDGSSRFGPGKQFGNFGSIGAAWIFSKENLIADLFPFLSLGKLRGSIGRTGNDQISDYNFLSTYNPTSGYLGTSGLIPTKLANPNYGWETINKIEGALELGFLKNSILVNASIYRNRTSNQLVGYSLPAVTGFNTIIANLPAVIQNKGLELDLKSTNVNTTKFSWTTSLNVSFPQNKLVSYPNLEASSYATRYAIGQSLSTKFVYKYSGVDPKTGIYTFEDLDKSGSVNSTKDRYFVFYGQKYFGGLNNSLNYKGISLDVFIQFVKQTGSKFAGIITPGRLLLTGSNMPVEFLNRWKTSGDVATYQKYNVTTSDPDDAFSRFGLSDERIVDASFIRLKNISLSWQLPKRIIDHLKIQSARIYMQTQNLLTITKFDGLDPENQTPNDPGLPPLKILTLGVQISL